MENVIDLLLVLFYLGLAYLAGFLTTTQFLNAVGAIGGKIQQAFGQAGAKRQQKYGERASKRGELAKSWAGNTKAANYARQGARRAGARVGQTAGLSGWTPTSKLGKVTKAVAGLPGRRLEDQLSRAGSFHAEAQTKRLSGAMKAMDESLLTDDEMKLVMEGGDKLRGMKNSRAGLRDHDDLSLRQAAAMKLASKGKKTSDGDIMDIINQTQSSYREAYKTQLQDTFTSAGTSPSESIGGYIAEDSSGNRVAPENLRGNETYRMAGMGMRKANESEAEWHERVKNYQGGAARGATESWETYNSRMVNELAGANADNKGNGGPMLNLSADKIGGLRPEQAKELYTPELLAKLAESDNGKAQIAHMSEALANGRVRSDTAAILRKRLEDAVTNQDHVNTGRINSAQQKAIRDQIDKGNKNAARNVAPGAFGEEVKTT